MSSYYSQGNKREYEKIQRNKILYFSKNTGVTDILKAERYLTECDWDEVYAVQTYLITLNSDNNDYSYNKNKDYGNNSNPPNEINNKNKPKINNDNKKKVEIKKNNYLEFKISE